MSGDGNATYLSTQLLQPDFKIPIQRFLSLSLQCVLSSFPLVPRICMLSTNLFLLLCRPVTTPLSRIATSACDRYFSKRKLQGRPPFGLISGSRYEAILAFLALFTRRLVLCNLVIYTIWLCVLVVSSTITELEDMR